MTNYKIKVEKGSKNEQRSCNWTPGKWTGRQCARRLPFARVLDARGDDVGVPKDMRSTPGRNMDPKMVPKWRQNGSQNALPNGAQKKTGKLQPRGPKIHFFRNLRTSNFVGRYCVLKHFHSLHAFQKSSPAGLKILTKKPPNNGPIIDEKNGLQRDRKNVEQKQSRQLWREGLK